MSRILFGEAAQQALHQSLARSVRAAAATGAPRHGTLLYDRGGRPQVAQDGFEAVRETADGAGAQSIGARILKETLAEAHRDLGDGTARLALFIGAAMAAGSREIAAGAGPSVCADALLALRAEVEVALRSRRVAVSAPALLGQAEGVDEAVAGHLVAAIAHAGVGGALDVRAGHRDETGLETGEGFLLELEPVSPHLPPAVGERLELTRPSILVANEVPSTLGRLVPLLDQFATRGKSLAIIARGASGQALDTVVVNGRLPGATLTALQPSIAGIGAVAALEDLAIATGATLIDPALGTGLDHIRPSMLGRAEKLVLSRGLACFEGSAGDPVAIKQRQADIHAAYDRQQYLALDRERLARREARLSGRWARLTLSAQAGEGREAFDARLASVRKILVQIAAAEAGGVVPNPGVVISDLARSYQERRFDLDDGARAARAALAAGLMALASGCGTAQWDAVSTLVGIVQKAISATATMLRIAAIIAV